MQCAKKLSFFVVAVTCTTTGGTDSDVGAAVGQGAVKESRALETYKNNKIVTNYVCFF